MAINSPGKNSSQVSLSLERQRHAAAIRGGLEGGSMGSGVVIPTLYLLNKRSTYYQSIPFPIKLLSGAVLIAPLVTIQAERRSLEFDRLHWTGIGKSRFEQRQHEKDERWAGLSRRDKAAEWAANHQLSVITGSWATTIALAGSVIMRDPLLTMPQKVVQVRLWAQGLTIGVIIAAATLTHAQRAQAREAREHGDHSWEHTLEDERLEKGL